MKVYTIPVHINDFLSDTQHLSAAEMGAYWRLILHHYRIGESGLPNDQKKLARLAGCSGQLWGKIGDNVLAMFEKTPEGYTQSRVLGELSNAVDRSEQARAKALKRWDSSYAVAKSQQCCSNANHKPINHKPINLSKEDGRMILEKFVLEGNMDDLWREWSEKMEEMGYGYDFCADFLDKAITRMTEKTKPEERRYPYVWRKSFDSYIQKCLETHEAK